MSQKILISTSFHKEVCGLGITKDCYSKNKDSFIQKVTIKNKNIFVCPNCLEKKLDDKNWFIPLEDMERGDYKKYFINKLKIGNTVRFFNLMGGANKLEYVITDIEKKYDNYLKKSYIVAISFKNDEEGRYLSMSTILDDARFELVDKIKTKIT